MVSAVPLGFHLHPNTSCGLASLYQFVDSLSCNQHPFLLSYFRRLKSFQLLVEEMILLVTQEHYFTRTSSGHNKVYVFYCAVLVAQSLGETVRCTSVRHGNLLFQLSHLSCNAVMFNGILIKYVFCSKLLVHGEHNFLLLLLNMWL